VPNDECWYQLECKNDLHKKAIKTAVHRINQYVAKNGGWTYVGWLRTGSVSDESDDTHKGVENIASEKQDPHISYLYPTKPDVVSETNEEYMKLVLKIEELVET